MTQHHFTTQEAMQATKSSPTAVRAALRRLKRKGRFSDLSWPTDEDHFYCQILLNEYLNIPYNLSFFHELNKYNPTLLMSEAGLIIHQ